MSSKDQSGQDSQPCKCSAGIPDELKIAIAIGLLIIVAYLAGGFLMGVSSWVS